MPNERLKSARGQALLRAGSPKVIPNFLRTTVTRSWSGCPLGGISPVSGFSDELVGPMAFSRPGPAVSYGTESRRGDTLHAHSRCLGKIAAKLAPPYPAPARGACGYRARLGAVAAGQRWAARGRLVVGLDLHSHDAGRRAHRRAVLCVPLTPAPRRRQGNSWIYWPAGATTGGRSRSTRRPREVPLSAPSRTRTPSNATYEVEESPAYFVRRRDPGRPRAFAEFPLVLTAGPRPDERLVRLPSTSPSASCRPPRGAALRHFITTANAGDFSSVEVAGGRADGPLWQAGFFAYAHPVLPPDDLRPVKPRSGGRSLGITGFGDYPPARLDDVRAAPDPHSYALRIREFARSAFQHACLLSQRYDTLAASAEGAAATSRIDHPSRPPLPRRPGRALEADLSGSRLDNLSIDRLNNVGWLRRQRGPAFEAGLRTRGRLMEAALGPHRPRAIGP